MCWSIPGKVLRIEGEYALIELAGVQKRARIDLVSDVQVGDYVLVHAGYAIQKVDESSARFTIDFFEKKGSGVEVPR